MQERLNNARKGTHFRTFPLHASNLDSWIDFAKTFWMTPTEIQEIVEDFRKAYEDYTNWLTDLMQRPL